MHISNKGLNLICEFEGCYLNAYRDCVGVWTIGYGHTEGVYSGQRLSSKEEAIELLRRDLANKYEHYVNNCPTLTFSPNQNQYDALVSFVYNCGSGSLNTLCRNRSASQVADALLLYNKGINGVVYAGLTRRRKAERALFLDLNCSEVSNSSAIVRDCTEGQHIKELQELCNKYGANIAEDGILGPKTKNAVKNCLPVLRQGSKGDAVYWVQQQLNFTGEDLDGCYGPKTSESVRIWQSNNADCFGADGIVGYNTYLSIATRR